MKKLFNNISTKDVLYISIIYIFLGFVLYYKSLGAGFVFDMIDWCSNYKKYGYQDIFHPPYDYTVRPVYHFILCSFWKLFGTHEIYWSLITLSFHILNSVLLYMFLRILFFKIINNIVHTKILAALSSLLFLVSPINTEVVVWYACFHYLFTIACLLILLILFDKYFQKSNLLFCALYTVLYLLAAYSIELAYTIPIVLSIYFLLFKYNNLKDIKLFFYIVGIPSILITTSIFILTKYFYGIWVGHYKLVDNQINLYDIIYHINIYTVKYLYFFRYLDYGKIESLTIFFRNKVYVICFILFLSVLSFLFIKVVLKKDENKRVLFFLIFSTIVLILPLSIQYFWFMSPIVGDRYQYPMGIFFLPLIVYITYKLFHKYIFVLFIFIVTFYYIYNLDKNLTSWHDAHIVHTSLIKDYRWYNAKRVFVLTNANYVNGSYIFGAEDDLRRTLHLYNDEKVLKIPFIYLSYFNMSKLSDDINVTNPSDSTIKIEFKQFGNWFWKDLSKGLPDDSNSLYTLKKDPNWGMSMDVQFHDIRKGDVFIYQKNLHWNEILFDKKIYK